MSKLVTCTAPWNLAWRALDEYVLEGFPTTIPFHKRVMNDPEFQAGRLHTRFLEEMNQRPGIRPDASEPLEDYASIVVALAAASPDLRNGRVPRVLVHASPWKAAGRRRQMDQRL